MQTERTVINKKSERSGDMKRIIAAVLGTALSAISCMGAYASQMPEFYVSISQSGEYIFNISGRVESGKSGQRVNIIIFNPQKGFSDTEDTGALQYQAELITGDDGSFSLQAPVYFDGVNDTGIYTLYLSGDDYSEALTLSAFAADPNTIKNAIKEIKEADTANLEKAIVDNEDILSLTGLGYEELDKGGLAEIIDSNRDTEGFLDENDVNGSLKRLKQLVIVECFNQGKISLITKNGEFLYPEYIDFSQIDKDGVSIYKAYFEIIKDKEAFVNSITGKNAKGREELLDIFAENAFVRAISDPITGGSGHIKKVLTSENAHRVGIDISEYLSMSEKNKTLLEIDLLKENLKTCKEIEEYIKNYKTSGTQGGSNPGGTNGSGNKNNSTTLPPVSENQNNGGENTEKNINPFNDLDSVLWAKEAILNLYNSGTVNGISETEFNPMGKVTREQFTVMLMRAVRIQESFEEPEFADVVPGSYYAGYVQSAKDAGIVKGIGENNFGVGTPIKRQDIAVIVMNTLDYIKRTIDVKSEVNFIDETEDYAKEAVNYLAGAGIINGFPDNTFRGSQECTRAQAAKLIYEVLQALNR